MHVSSFWIICKKKVLSNMAANTAKNTTRVFCFFEKFPLTDLVFCVQVLLNVLINIRSGIILCENKMAAKMVV